MTYLHELKKIRETYPSDFSVPPAYLADEPKVVGEQQAVGQYTDEWGCAFENIHPGIIGEVRDPIIKDWNDRSRMHIPVEQLTIDKTKINAFCGKTEKFTRAKDFPRPFERLQFLRGTSELFMDLATGDSGMRKCLSGIHEFYSSLLERWADTDVDSLWMMDDWGSQQSLLISPAMWQEYFKPLYAEYIAIAHAKGKKMFMHSDGHILAIIPHLIEIGLDALNSQVFCMGLENLDQFKGKITFWGELDRQHIIPAQDLSLVAQAVEQQRNHLYCDGGFIAQCEMGPGANPAVINEYFKLWS